MADVLNLAGGITRSNTILSAGFPILSLSDTLWFGPAVTWPKELVNYPYIHFWHRLDSALLSEQIPGLGSEVLGEDAWEALFWPGPLTENSDISMTIRTNPVFHVRLEPVDQDGTNRPAGSSGDIGAIEIEQS